MKKTAEGNQLKDDVSNYDPSVYKSPSVTVDICICTIFSHNLNVVLIKRKFPPFRGHWAIPGGFVNVEDNEDLETSALRELDQETGLKNIYLEQLKTYGDPYRDSRKRIITVAHFALIPYDKLKRQMIKANDDAREVKWFSLRKLPEELAFDHDKILLDLLERLIDKISSTPIAFNLLSEKFTWTQLQEVYEIILGRKLIASNFRRKIKSMYKIKELNDKRRVKGKPGRPPVYLMFEKVKEL